MPPENSWREYLEPSEMEEVKALDAESEDLKKQRAALTDRYNRLRNRCYGRMRIKRGKEASDD